MEPNNFNEKDRSRLKASAWTYFELGLNVVPTKGKKPLIDWKKLQKSRQSEADFEVLPWNDANGFAVIGGSQGKNGCFICAIDSDVRNVSSEAVEKGKQVIGMFPPTLTESTPSGGSHSVYWSKHKPTTIGSYRKESALELLGENKLIMMAPSEGYTRSNDKSPAIVDDLDLTFKEMLKKAGVRQAPRARACFDRNKFKKKHYDGPHPPCVSALLSGVEQGERNEVSIRLASYFLNFRGDTFEHTLECLNVWNESNSPPLSEEEVTKTIRSAEKNDYVYCCDDSLLKANCREDACPLLTHDKKQNAQYTPFVELPDGQLAEQAFDGKEVYFLVYNPKNGEVVKKPEIECEGAILRPIDNDEVRAGTVLLPSDVEEYGTEEQLTKDIKEFLDRWHEAPNELSRLIDSTYVRLSYVQDLVPQVPYRSLLAEYGKGKSAWLETVGSTCYRPLFLSGADTDKSIVRKMHVWRGTPLIDEADFSKSDLFAFLTKILNTGFDRKMGWYQRADDNDPYKILQYYVFCCKLLARRARYKDIALESRCLTDIGRENIEDIPMYRLETFKEQALHLRNKLTLWRFRNYHKIKENTKCLEDKTLARSIFGDLHSQDISGRAKQIIMPLWVIGDEHVRSELRALAKKISMDLMIHDEKYSLQLDAIDAIKVLWSEGRGELDRQFDEEDKGICERKGEPVREAETVISTIRSENEVFYTVPLSAVSRKIILLKGTPEDEIKRRDIISYSKSLKTLFESRLSFRFQIGKNHERVVLMPARWFKNMVESTDLVECRNVENVLEPSLAEKDDTTVNKINDSLGQQSEHSLHADIPDQGANEAIHKGDTLSRARTNGKEKSKWSDWLTGIMEKSDVESMVWSKLFEHEMTCPICGRSICEPEEKIEIPGISGKAYAHDTCYKERGAEGKHWFDYAWDLVLFLEGQFEDGLERERWQLEDIAMELLQREDDEEDQESLEREFQSWEKWDIWLELLQRDADEEDLGRILRIEKFRRELRRKAEERARAARAPAKKPPKRV